METYDWSSDSLIRMLKWSARGNWLVILMFCCHLSLHIIGLADKVFVFFSSACSRALGMEKGLINDSQITASSEESPEHSSPSFARLHQRNGWVRTSVYHFGICWSSQIEDVVGDCVAYCVESNVVKIINVVPYGLLLRDIRIRNCFPNAFSSIWLFLFHWRR